MWLHSELCLEKPFWPCWKHGMNQRIPAKWSVREQLIFLQHWVATCSASRGKCLTSDPVVLFVLTVLTHYVAGYFPHFTIPPVCKQLQSLGSSLTWTGGNCLRVTSKTAHGNLAIRTAHQEQLCCRTHFFFFNFEGGLLSQAMLQRLPWY